jgi:MFS_1 like family
MALVEPLHGLTFALLHLACMQMLSAIVPPALAATAQAIYGTVAIGAMTAILSLVSGPLYGSFGARAFWAMALLCAAALPIAFAMRRISINSYGSKPYPAGTSVVACRRAVPSGNCMSTYATGRRFDISAGFRALVGLVASALSARA